VGRDMDEGQGDGIWGDRWKMVRELDDG
jgi:hypothetical protein